MTFEQIQNELANLDSAARTHGLESRTFTLELRPHSSPSLYISWRDPITEASISRWEYADTPGELFALVRERLRELPPKEDRERGQYLKHIAKAIEYGRKIGIDEAFINPLELQMKKLSANIIEHKPSVPDEDDSTRTLEDIPF